MAGIGLLGGVGDKLLAHRSFADFAQGAKGSAVRDRLNAGLAEAAAAGQTVTGSAGIWSLDGPLHIPANLKVVCDDGCIIQKAFDEKGSGNALLLTAGDQARDADGWNWSGGRFQPQDANLGTGNLATLFGRNWTFRNATMRDWRGGQSFIFGGGGFSMSDIDARSSVAEVGTGAYRCVWNDPAMPSLCTRLYGMSGDDVFQAAPISTADHPRFGLDVGKLTYDDCEGLSHIARLIVAIVVRGRPWNETLLPSKITDITFRNIRGKGGRRSISIENSFGDLQKGSTIDNILIENCDIDCGSESSDLRESVRLWSDRDAIGSVKIRNSRIVGSRSPNLINANGVRSLVIDGGSVLQSAGVAIAAGGKYGVSDISLDNVDITAGNSGREPAMRLSLKDKLSLGKVSVNGDSNPGSSIRMNGGRMVNLPGN